MSTTLAAAPPRTVLRPAATSGNAHAATDTGEHHFSEYRVYVESILRSLRPESLRVAMQTVGLSGRTALEEALSGFVAQLRGFVTGCDDRKLSKAALRRARGIESQLASVSKRLLVAPLTAGVLVVDDLHGIWHGFAEVRGWRDSRVPQVCLLQMLRGALAELNDEESERWTSQALTWELTLPEVHQAISVSAWPPLCELLGRLPDCVTPAELQEALWQQSFVENPTHAPDHRNYRRFAVLAAQMVAIGVELESDKVELLVQQTLDLDRPWRERRDMLSGILSAASVEDRRRVVQSLDRRFEEHADIDDFEIVCGIAEHIGIEIPREGAIRRCALRRWALDAKRGGALPVARLIDFVDADTAIGEDVATSLRQKGRVADAALLLSRLPRSQDAPDLPLESHDVNSGDAELARLCELLALDEDGAKNAGGEGVFGPIEEGAFRLPFGRPEQVGYSSAAQAAVAAAQRLRGKRFLAVGVWKEEAPFWHSPLTLLAFCAEDSAELFDLAALQMDGSGSWPEAANCLRFLLSDPQTLKVACGGEVLHTFAHALGLGIANTLKRGEREPLGPYLDMRALMADVLSCSTDHPANAWPAVARRFLGLRLCPEEAGSNWSRRPLRASQLHHAVSECWTQLPVLRAVCAYGIVPPALARRHVSVQSKVRSAGGRNKGNKAHAIGQLAPPGRLAWTDLGQHQPPPPGAADQASDDKTAQEPALPEVAAVTAPTRVAVLVADLPGAAELPALVAGSLVEVLDERFGGLASVAPLGVRAVSAVRRVAPSVLRATNGWECPSWLAALPRPRPPPTPAAQQEPSSGGKAGEQAPAARAPATAVTATAATPAAAASVHEKPVVDHEGLARALLEDLRSPALAKQILRLTYDAQQQWP